MSSICWRIAWASKPTCGNAHSSSSSSTSSSSCFILSLFFLKVGISFPGHFFKVAARTAFFLKTNNELWATLVGKHFKKNYSLWNNDNRKKNPYFDGFFLCILTNAEDEEEEQVELSSTSTNCLNRSWSPTVFNPHASSWLVLPFVPRTISSWPLTTPCSVSIITKVKINASKVFLYCKPRGTVLKLFTWR